MIDDPAPAAPPAGESWDRALVVFSGRADLAWLRLLRPGFRHCFVVLGASDGWICINPMAHRTAISVVAAPASFDLAGWYRDRGLVVVETVPTAPPRRQAPWRPYTCVEAVKRILGIHRSSILTPWQLFRHLTKDGIKSLTVRGPSDHDASINTLLATKINRNTLSGERTRPVFGTKRDQMTGKDQIMGGFLFADKPAAPVVVQTAAPVAPAVSPAPAAAPVETAAEVEAETKARQDTISRNRRGLYGTIVTSDAGLLDNRGRGGKTLLGE